MKRFFIILFVTAIGVLGDLYSLTRQEIRDTARQIAGDNVLDSQGNLDTKKIRWTNAQWNTRIKIAELDITKKTECLTKIDYITTFTSQTEYDLPSDFSTIKEAAIWISSSTGRNVYEKLLNDTRDKIHAVNNRWEKANVGIPERYYMQASSWGLRIGLYYAPNRAYTGTDFLRVIYTMKVNPMDSDDDSPWGGVGYLEPYHQLIILWIVKDYLLEIRRIQEWAQVKAELDTELKRMYLGIRSMPDYRGSIIAEEYNDSRKE